jgi:DNA-binding transcriptional ArsR family regulator
VLWALLQGESSVACLAELAGAAPAAVSQHLAGLVKGHREGTFVYYPAADDHVKGLLDQALFHARPPGPRPARSRQQLGDATGLMDRKLA